MPGQCQHQTLQLCVVGSPVSANVRGSGGKTTATSLQCHCLAPQSPRLLTPESPAVGGTVRRQPESLARSAVLVTVAAMAEVTVEVTRVVDAPVVPPPAPTAVRVAGIAQSVVVHRPYAVGVPSDPSLRVFWAAFTASEATKLKSLVWSLAGVGFRQQCFAASKLPAQTCRELKLGSRDILLGVLDPLGAVLHAIVLNGEMVGPGPVEVRIGQVPSAYEGDEIEYLSAVHSAVLLNQKGGVALMFEAAKTTVYFDAPAT